MRWNNVRLVVMAAACAAGTLSGGCFVAADALNPSFFAGLGFDPGTIFPSAGTVIVSFTNNTTASATFFAYEGVSASDLSRKSRNFTKGVDPNSRGNEVLTCPVGVISFGTLDASFTPDDIAANVIATTGATEVTYAGGQLVRGIDFDCGDVIDVALNAVTTSTDTQGGTQSAYSITVRVIPGQ